MGHHKKPKKKETHSDRKKPDTLYTDEHGSESTQHTKTAEEEEPDKPQVLQAGWFRRACRIMVYHYRRTTGQERLTTVIAFGAVVVATWVAEIYNGQLNVMRRQLTVDQ